MSLNISPNSPYHTESSQPIFQEENSPLMKRRRIMGEEEIPQSSASMIEFSEGENPTPLEMTESILDKEEEVRPTQSTRKRKRGVTTIPLSEDQRAILSIFEKTSQCIAAGILKKEESSVQQKPGYQQPHWDALLKGFAIGASPEDQMKAAHALFPLTQKSLNWCKGKLASNPKETANDAKTRCRWEAIDIAITPGASTEKQKEGIEKLQALLNTRKGWKRNDDRKRDARIPENLFSYTIPEPSSLLLIIEKTSRYIDDKHVWNRCQSYTSKVQAPRWKALLNGIKDKATEEEQEEAAKNLAALIQDIQPRYIQGNIRESSAEKPRMQWNAISEGIRHNASEITKQEAVKHLEAIIQNFVKASTSNRKEKDLAKDQNNVVNPASSFPSTPQNSALLTSALFTEECPLSPLPELTVNAEIPQNQMIEQTLPRAVEQKAPENCSLIPSQENMGSKMMDEFDIGIFFNDAYWLSSPPELMVNAEIPQNQMIEQTLPRAVEQKAPENCSLTPSQENMGSKMMDEFDIGIFFNDAYWLSSLPELTVNTEASSQNQMIEQTPSRGIEQEIPDDWSLTSRQEDMGSEMMDEFDIGIFFNDDNI